MAFIHFIINFTLTQVHLSKKKPKQPVYNSIIKNKKYMLATSASSSIL